MRTLTLFVLALLLPLTLLAEEDWIRHEIGILESRGSTPVDFDLDGDIDILTRDYTYGRLRIWINDGSGSFSTDILVDDITDPSGPVPLDLDDDNDIDIVLRYRDGDDIESIGILWNTGNAFLLENVITLDEISFTGTVIDVDNDNDLDIQAYTDSTMIWLLNDGNNNFVENIIHLQIDDLVGLKCCDYDSDGDYDAIISRDHQNTAGTYYLENIGNDQYVFHQITTLRGYFHIIADPDLQYPVVCISNASEVFYFYYDGNIFTSEMVTDGINVAKIDSYDFDSNNHQDIIINIPYTGIFWYQKRSPTLYKPWQISTSFYSHGLQFTADMDGDGDHDVITIGERFIDKVLSWHENPSYHLGVDVNASIDDNGTVELSWFDLNASQYLIQRDGLDLAVTSSTVFTDQFEDYGYHEYTVTPDPQLPAAKASYPCGVFWADPDDVVEFADFEDGLPPTWTIQNQSATYTWSTGPGPSQAEFELFETDCAYNGWSEDPAAPWSGTLLTGYHTKGLNDRVFLGLDSIARLNSDWLGTDCRLLVWTSPGFSWITLRDYDRGHRNYQFFDLTDLLDGQSQFKIGFEFYSTDFRDIWGIDNVVIVVEEKPVSFTLDPQSTTIPEFGGTLIYDATVVSQLSFPVPYLSYWIDIDLPTGQTITRTLLNDITLPALADITVEDMTLYVPSAAPAGQYTFTGYLGRQGHPNLQLRDSFTFTKLGDAVDTVTLPVPGDWVSGNLDGWLIATNAVGETPLPSVYELAAPHPNPFNPTTTVSVALPAASDLHIAVYNTLGQVLATLADGRVNAGEHQFVFDGSHLASGVYFVHASVPGKLDQTRKIVLMK